MSHTHLKSRRACKNNSLSKCLLNVNDAAGCISFCFSFDASSTDGSHFEFEIMQFIGRKSDDRRSRLVKSRNDFYFSSRKWRKNIA